MNRKELLTQLIKDLEKERDTCDQKTCEDRTPIPKLRVRIPDENTPINTILKTKNNKNVFFGCMGESKNHVVAGYIPFCIENECHSEIDSTIDTIADLKFRMFLNAPAEYKYGAIDKDGTGNVFIKEPRKDDYDRVWITTTGFMPVGEFKQYANEWHKILIERD